MDAFPSFPVADDIRAMKKLDDTEIDKVVPVRPDSRPCTDEIHGAMYNDETMPYQEQWISHVFFASFLSIYSP